MKSAAPAASVAAFVCRYASKHPEAETEDDSDDDEGGFVEYDFSKLSKSRNSVSAEKAPGSRDTALPW